MHYNHTFNKFILKFKNFDFTTAEINFFFSILYLIAICILFTPIGEIFLSATFPRHMNLSEGDSHSYINFSFQNLETILSQHRSFGLPLILKTYTIFDEKLKYWPHFTFVFFILSNNLMLNFFLKSDINKLFSIFFSSLLFCSYNVWEYAFGWTELWGISFFMLSLAMIISYIKNQAKNKFFLLIAVIFFTYQIRPSFVFFLIIPFIFLIFFLFKKNFFLFKEIATVSIVPLILFLFFKFLITNHIGLTPFTGVQLSGHAVYYLDENTINKMTDSNNILFAKKIFSKKQNLSEPCNSKQNSQINQTYVHEFCWNIYLMEAWVEMTRQEINTTPFKDENKNIESWRYMNLDGYFSKIKNNILIDKKLLSFSMEVLKINFSKHLSWLFDSGYLIIKYYFAHPAIKKVVILSILILIYLIFFTKKINFTKEKFFTNENEKLLFYSIICYSIISLLFFAFLHIPNQRTAGVQFIFLVPIFTSYLAYMIIKNKN